MGIAVMILGESGSGKSTSLRNFDKNDVGIINIANKPMPFKSDLKSVIFNTNSYAQIHNALRNANKPSIVIDDSQFLMVNAFMNSALEKGYEKFTLIGKDFFELINQVKDMPEDKIVYFLHHVDKDETGMVRAKTIGRLLNDKVTLEGMFTIVLRATNSDGKYVFRTQSNGNDTTKSPMEMFKDVEVPNDLNEVDKVIREYYGIPRVYSQPKTEPVKAAVTVTKSSFKGEENNG